MPKPYIIQEPRQIAALASPARQEIVDAAQSLGACSIAEIARALGRAPDSLYYHVRALLRVGLLVEAGSRPGRRRPESLYRTPGSPMRLDRKPRQRPALGRVSGAMLRIASRDLQSGIRRSTSRLEGPARNTYSARYTARLTDAQLADLNQRIDRLMQSVLRAPADENGHPISLTVVLAPARPRRTGQTRPSQPRNDRSKESA